jgi:hypothetical protein
MRFGHRERRERTADQPAIATRGNEPLGFSARAVAVIPSIAGGGALGALGGTAGVVAGVVVGFVVGLLPRDFLRKSSRTAHPGGS